MLVGIILYMYLKYDLRMNIVVTLFIVLYYTLLVWFIYIYIFFCSFYVLHILLYNIVPYTSAARNTHRYIIRLPQEDVCGS